MAIIRDPAALRIAPPLPVTAESAENVVSVTVRALWFEMALAPDAAEFFEKVLPVTVRVPWFEITLPLEDAERPEKTLLLMVSVPRFETAPPLASGLVMVTPKRNALAPESTAITSLLPAEILNAPVPGPRRLI